MFLFYKDYILIYFFSLETLKVFMAFAGFFILIFNTFNLACNNCFLSNNYVIFIISGLFTLAIRRPKFNCYAKINDTGTTIKITIGNIFQQHGDIIIPVDTSFNTLVNEQIVSKTSIHGQFINMFFKNNTSSLDWIIKRQLTNRNIIPTSQRKSFNNGKTDVYSIGTSIYLTNTDCELIDDDDTYILCSTANLNNYDIANSSANDIFKSCQSVFKLFMSELPCAKKIHIPLLGTFHGRTFQKKYIYSIYIIIYAFLSNPEFSNCCEELNIVIYKNDYPNLGLSIYDLENNLKILCNNPHIFHYIRHIIYS